MKVVRSKLTEENPEMKLTEMAKKMGDMWKALEDKREYEEKAAVAKATYAEELAAYYEKYPEKKAAAEAAARPKPKKSKSDKGGDVRTFFKSADTIRDSEDDTD